MALVIGCIDGSLASRAVCDASLWAAGQLGLPLTFLHVLDRRQYPGEGDLSGSLGLGSREHLLEELASLDERRSRLALDHGRHALDAARAIAQAQGVQTVALQRHGSLVDSLREREADLELVVLGRHGTQSDTLGQHLGSQLENVARAVQRPVLIVPVDFTRPRHALVAFDGSDAVRAGVHWLIRHQLFKGMALHLVRVGEPDDAAHGALAQTAARLVEAGYPVQVAVCPGPVDETLLAYQDEHELDLLAMGAFGHSRIRHLFMGSTTRSLIRKTGTSLLLMR